MDGMQHMIYTKNQDSPYTNKQWALITEALKLRYIIESSDFNAFFRALRNPKLNYFFACIMIRFLKNKCINAFLSLRLSYKSQSISFEILS